MKYTFIGDHLKEFPVSRMCSALEIAPSGYYKWCRQAQGHSLSSRKEADNVLSEQIDSVFEGSRKLYGSPQCMQLSMLVECCGGYFAHPSSVLEFIMFRRLAHNYDAILPKLEKL